VLGISQETVTAGGVVKYYKDPAKAVSDLAAGVLQAAFFLNPVTVREFRDVSLSGHVLPQKTTFFYPKILTGLLIFSTRADERVPPRMIHQPARIPVLHRRGSLPISPPRFAAARFSTWEPVPALSFSPGSIAPELRCGSVEIQRGCGVRPKEHRGERACRGASPCTATETAAGLSRRIRPRRLRPRRLGEGRRNPDPRKEIARHEVTCTLSDVFHTAGRYLSPRGRFAMIGLPKRLPEILSCAAAVGIFPERLRFVHPYADRPANLLLFAGSRRKSPELSVLPDLAVYASRGRLHPEMERIYRGLTPP
jgi:hypothetical protein